MVEEEVAVAEAVVVEEEAVVEEVVVVVEEEVEAVEQQPQEEEPIRTQSYWEENPNTLKEIDETSTDSSPTSSPI